MEGFTQTQISTLAVRDNLLIAGGFQGELICKVYPIYLCRGIVTFFLLFNGFTKATTLPLPFLICLLRYIMHKITISHTLIAQVGVLILF